MRPIWIDNLIQPPRDWQTQLIHHNLLAIGYSAWNGYLELGRGLVLCQLTAPLPEPMDWTVNSASLELRFVPESQVSQGHLADFLADANHADLPRLADQIQLALLPDLLEAISTYDPERSLLLLVYGNGEFNLSLLQDLAIWPRDCYKQVRYRWDEFASCLPSRSDQQSD
ncbi:MAG: hypothetical protein KME07_04925 [Pegethrix bostrychoides GSE-TBD4-15B]|jgi:hypothetical protein|uniref:Uncharacterized protein n=1 Tax=Pegethrix bostrychoides GSE-TBD4-15B TaxID=2839662 RepID=A0A951P9W5_9CYAN|nr:hypothetical protein [Pegethrix bostrychoides GSE-TBD4-15B]